MLFTGRQWKKFKTSLNTDFTWKRFTKQEKVIMRARILLEEILPELPKPCNIPETQDPHE